MSLKEKIDTYKEGFRAKAPEGAQAVMQRATEKLQNSRQMLNTVKVGDIAPDFILKNKDNADVALAGLLTRGPLVLGFYRGRW